MSALLKISGLRAGYGRVPVLHGIDLSVNDGEILGILGHNGMGKSTLLKTLMGIIPASGGSMTFDGQDIGRQRSSGRAQLGIGYVPQGRGIFPNLSVRDNLRMGIASHDLDEDSAIDRVLADFPRLERLLERDGGALSGGEQQLLALARCLVSEPDLILLDEPTEGIQPSIIDEIIDLLKELNRREGLSIVLVEQSLDFITALSDRVLLIQKGKIMGEVSGSEAADPALIEEFTGLGAGGGKSAKPETGSIAALSQGRSSPAASSPVPVPRPGASAPAHLSAAPAPLQERMSYMTVQRPTLSQMKAIVAELGMNMSDERVQEFLDVMQGTLDAYDIVDALPDYLPPVLYPRTSGYRPTPDENPMNAWYVKTEIKGAPRGPLLGRTIALKDNVCLAGVPMMNGASTLKGYTPDIDATIVTRLLDAGATIVGKAHCEYFCLSGGSHTNATGAVHNPHKHGYSAGGSSSGSGALVGAGLVDMAIGGDQGGSIRMPASFCGVYGMKPTHGLVPYSGIMPIETTIDHTGPMTQTVMDNALMLEVIAGPDGLDPRQYDVSTDKYTAFVSRGVSGLRIGVVKEGFGHPQSEEDVDASVRAGAEMFRRLGAMVDEISIPWHLHGPAIWTPIGLEGLTNQMMLGNGFGTGWEGLYTTSLLD
ncbi:MAG: amidase, partial [Rhodobacteraceae bacterium]|nr:amidase [Paracoccaceae bacterium]